jgi:hypothetical protein
LQRTNDPTGIELHGDGDVCSDKNRRAKCSFLLRDARHSQSGAGDAYRNR